MNPNFKDYLLKVTQATDCFEQEIIQSLWSGYGKISRFQLLHAQKKHVVVKNISLQHVNDHPRGWDTDISHNRKVKSYQVETHWYKNWAQRCSSDCPIPQFYGSYTQDADQWLILEDLNVHFPIRKHELELNELKVCLKWLANFHICFLGLEPTNLWKTGTYWHLETRPDEFKKIQHQALKRKAAEIDRLLNNCSYQTIVHGDAKLANFCFAENGQAVAAVDFQYVGGGCGMKDVAYFLGSCLSSEACFYYEQELLGYYFAALKTAFLQAKIEYEYQDLEDEWKSMYPLACADFTRFLMGWMPTHQKVHAYNLQITEQVLSEI